MKTNHSKAELTKFGAGLEEKGWAKTTKNGIDQYSSPMTELGEWVTITIFGRKVRTIASYHLATRNGLVDARIAASNIP